MYYLIFFLAYAVFLWNTKSIAVVLCLEFAVSAFCSLIIGKDVPFVTFFQQFNAIYTSLILAIFIYPFRKYPMISGFEEIDLALVRKITIVICVLGAFTAIVNGYVVFSILSLGNIDIEQFKNSGEVFQFAYSIPISHSLITLAAIFAPISYFLLAFGYFYYHRRERKTAFLCFFLSLNMPLYGFTMFSRSYTLMYAVLVIFIYIYSSKLFSKEAKKKIISILLFLALPIIVFFIYITFNRFKEYRVESDSLVSNPILYSLLDYFSQWVENGVIVLENYYSIQSIQFAASTNSLMPFLFNLVASVFGLEPIARNIQTIRSEVWPSPYYFSFNGLISELVFDFGYSITLFFSVVFAVIADHFAPISGKATINKFIAYGILIIIPVMSIFGNYFTVAFYDLIILYAIIIGSLGKLRSLHLIYKRRLYY